jgi:predicted transposase YdaD
LPEFLEKVRKQNIPNAETVIMSIAERIAERVRAEATALGEAKGRQEGRQEGLHRGALIGQIQALERVLRRSGSSEVELDECKRQPEHR